MDLQIDIKEKIEEAVKKLQKDPALLAGFQDDPIKTLEKLLDVDLPEEQLKPVVAGVKAKLASSDIGGKLGDLKKFL